VQRQVERHWKRLVKRRKEKRGTRINKMSGMKRNTKRLVTRQARVDTTRDMLRTVNRQN